MANQRLRVALTRRDFLTIAATAAASAGVAQVVTTGALSPFTQLKRKQLSGDPASRQHFASSHHWGMVIDLHRCIGCQYCQRACSAINDVAPDMAWNLVAEDRSSKGRPFFFTRPCLHCQHAPCVEVCPVQATRYREDGLVVMDYDRCIGCRYCQVACPYDARRFNWRERTDLNAWVPTWGIPEVARRPRGVVEKCTFCVHRIDRGLARGLTPGVDREATPACVNICPVGARTFGDLRDPESPVSQQLAKNATVRLREELGTEGSIYYIPPAEGL